VDAMKTYEEVEVFLMLAQEGGVWSASHPGCFTPGETKNTRREVTTAATIQATTGRGGTRWIGNCHTGRSGRLFILSLS